VIEACKSSIAQPGWLLGVEPFVITGPSYQISGQARSQGEHVQDFIRRQASNRYKLYILFKPTLQDVPCNRILEQNHSFLGMLMEIFCRESLSLCHCLATSASSGEDRFCGPLSLASSGTWVLRKACLVSWHGPSFKQINLRHSLWLLKISGPADNQGYVLGKFYRLIR